MTIPAWPLAFKPSWNGRWSQGIIGFSSRLVGALTALFGLLTVTFLIGRTMPIDPVMAIVGDKAPAEMIARVRAELGLDESLAEQFRIYLGGLFHGDLGNSIMTGKPVTADIMQFFPATLELATAAMLITILVGIPLGVLAAARQDNWIDHVIRVVSLIGQSLPVFVSALIGILIFYVKLGIAPGTGRQDIIYRGLVEPKSGLLIIDAMVDGQWDVAIDALGHIMLPALLLAFYSVSTVTRMTRTLMLDALNGEYIVTARAKGLSPAVILWRHGFRNAAGRLVALIALTYAGLLEGAVLTETVFSWPGLGLYLTRSLLNADMNAVLGATLVVGAVYIALNLLADLFESVLDPRVT